MSDLRQAAQQVLDAWQTSLYGKPSHQKAVVLAMTNLNIVLQQQAEPVASIYVSLDGAREFDDWKHELPVGRNFLFTTPPQQQAEPVGWLDGNDKLADFMHRDLKAEHDKRGSATPKDFTIPVYTARPQRKPLTDEEIDQLLPEIVSGGSFTVITYGRAVARAIEAAHCIQEPKP